MILSYGVPLDLLFLAGGLFLLWKGGDKLVDSAVRLALRTGISPTVVGATIVAFGTSAPELIVGAMAALQGKEDMALGNVVGSNIANIALVLGLSGLVSPMAVEKSIRAWDLPWLLISAGALALFTWVWTNAPGAAGEAEGAPALLPWEGGILLFLCVGFYVSATIRGLRSRGIPEELVGDVGGLARRSVWWDVGGFILGLAVLLGGSWALIEGATNLALLLGVPELVVGLTVVAVGTSLPELVTSLTAARKGHAGLAIANVTGSNIQNILLCLAAAVVLLPSGVMPIDADAAAVDVPVMIGVTLLLTLLLLTGKTIGRGKSLLLLIVYAGYVGVLVERALRGQSPTG